MLKKTNLVVIFLMAFILVFSALKTPVMATGSVDNQIYATLLKKHVIAGRVNYDGLKTDELLLDQYLEILSNTDIASLSKTAQFAFYINAYNAFTIKLILTRYPDLGSIKDLGGFLSSPWDIQFIRLQDKKISLDMIEHDILRPDFKDPRVHFAINCASKSCPPLHNEPYEPDRLEAQLDQQARAFINAENNFIIKGSQISISKIFKWFKGDFDDNPLKFIRAYASGNLKDALESNSVITKINYLDYDWSLNN
ncbi:conserved hypothetical protein [Desulforapulum autotrophicum HRM2]|uniref:DUF547 domain-containing protein n=1 Tax=Desulforapulum autotrophicum (strain ATCC 43914 / DSM 3382 / VKM B-1955 / HRM2) TaxID=177437 RepID=C0QH41_DESAH|nr:DUF547 domain-containing protein [Desulforapulum autotrophicum]ACN15690.1 conserved hypothetical protein [Desulforapulum autotrophicum HRM2]